MNRRALAAVAAATLAALPATAGAAAHADHHANHHATTKHDKKHDKGHHAQVGQHDGDVSRIYPMSAPAFGVVDGVTLDGGSYGSSLVAKPGSRDHVYGLTDRGPNVDAPDGGKIEPLPSFTPSIGEFVLQGNGRAKLVRRIPLRAADGTPMNGLVSTVADTGETIQGPDGAVLPKSPNGIDSEGLVALPDGTFWVSDEYGPFVAHFDKKGRMIERLSPQDGTLPKELANREPNKGMEGLTVTPDGKTLVGIMQAALNAPDNTGTKSKKISTLRIVTIDLRTKAVHEYAYVLHNTDGANTVVSEIAAMPDGTFLVDERDSAFEPGANKKLFRISLKDATDIGPASTAGTYDAAKGGLLVGGRSVEKLSGKGNTAQTTDALVKAGIRPVSSSLFLDVAGYVTSVDPTGGYFGHDKVEGVAVLDGGRTIALSNDSDFGVDHVTNTAAPWAFGAKVLPDGRPDTGEILRIDVTKVPARFRG